MDFVWPSNETNVNESASARFLIFNSFLLSVDVLMGTCGNVFVCCAVLRNRSLRTANNALLFNLSVVAFLKCSLDSPLFLSSLIVGEKRVGIFLCCVQQFTYSLFTCVQFLTLVLISMDRYQAVAFPFKNRNERIRIWILLLWVCGLFFAILSLTLCDDFVCYMTCRHLRKFSPSRADPFGVYVLVPVWGFSLVLVIVYNVRIFLVVRQHTRKITDIGVQFKPSLGTHRPRFDLHSAPRTAAAARVQKPGTARESASFQPLDEFRGACDTNHADTRIAGAVCILTPAARELGKKRLEGRVAKRLGYIIITVIIFWAPLFVILCVDMSEDFSQNQVTTRS